MTITKIIDSFTTLFFRKASKQIQKSRAGKLKSTCPYCERLLEKTPQRKTKCPLCKNYIYIRTHPDTRQKLLVTKDKADKIDCLHHKRYEKQKWLDNLRKFGVTNRVYEKHQTDLFKEWGKEPSQRDILWRIFNELVASYSDPQDKSQIYYEMALFLDEEGKDATELLEQHNRMALLELKQDGYTKVNIRSTGGCMACKEQDGKVYTINQALQEMPLPCKKCSFLMNSQEGFCRCCYQAVIDD